VIEPIVELAREGFVISKDLADEVSKNIDYDIFYTGPLNPGDRLQLHELTKTLDIIIHGTTGTVCILQLCQSWIITLMQFCLNSLKLHD